VLQQKLKNGFTASDKIWHVHCKAPAERNRLCPVLIRVFHQKSEIKNYIQLKSIIKATSHSSSSSSSSSSSMGWW